MMPERSRAVARLAAFLLLALGAWRIVVVVGASPMLGYANQFDMGRTSACFGLWPDLPEPARYEAHPQAPIARYVRGEQRPAECYPAASWLFVATAVAIAPRDHAVDLRIVGAVKGAALILVAFGLDAALKRRPAWALANAAVFAIVLAEPMTTLWLNTLYTEFGALLGAYASIGLLPVLVMRDPVSAPPPRWALAGFACGVAVLGLSRQQHLFLPAVLALPVLFSLWRPARRATLGLAMWVLAIALAQGMIERPATIIAANTADVVLGAILPASRDPLRTAARLGLPERCLQSSGASWYETMGETLSTSCPEALAMPRRSLADAGVRRAADDRAGGAARAAAAAGLATRLSGQRRRSRFRRQRRCARRRRSGGDEPGSRRHRASATGFRTRPGRIARLADRKRGLRRCWRQSAGEAPLWRSSSVR